MQLYYQKVRLALRFSVLVEMVPTSLRFRLNCGWC